MNKRPIKTALCAFGMSGRVFHGPLLEAHDGFELVAVWQRSSSDAQDLYPKIRIVRTYEEILADPSIELVVVNTPEYTHAPLAEQALQAGKHVVVEKAFTVTVAEADRLIALAREKRLVLSVFQNRRWDSDFLTIQHLLQQKTIGRIVEYEANYNRYRRDVKDSWKEQKLPGTGILYNLGSHLIDQALVLFGSPTTVWADLRMQRTAAQVPDHFQLVLGYPDLKVNLRAGYLIHMPPPKYIVFGEMGTIAKAGVDPQEEALAAGQKPGTPGWGEEDPKNCASVSLDDASEQIYRVNTLPGNYLTFYTQLHQAVREGSSNYLKGEDGRRVIQIIEAAQQSWKEERVIHLSALA